MSDDYVSYVDLEKYIKAKKPHGYLRNQCFSPSFHKAEKNALQMAKESQTPKLIYFANNGYRSYFYYKSNDNNTYLFEFFLGEIYDYYPMPA